MIGIVRWEVPGEDGNPPIPRTATLRDDGTFAVAGRGGEPVPGLADLLTAQYRESNPSPADGAPGAKFLADLAAKYGGTYELASYTPDPPGTIH